MDEHNPLMGADSGGSGFGLLPEYSKYDSVFYLDDDGDSQQELHQVQEGAPSETQEGAQAVELGATTLCSEKGRRFTRNRILPISTIYRDDVKGRNEGAPSFLVDGRPIPVFYTAKGYPTLSDARMLINTSDGIAIIDFTTEVEQSQRYKPPHADSRVDGMGGPKSGDTDIIDGQTILRRGGVFKGSDPPLKLWRYDINAANTADAKKWEYPYGFFLIHVRPHSPMDQEKSHSRAQAIEQTKQKKRKLAQERRTINPTDGALRTGVNEPVPQQSGKRPGLTVSEPRVAVV